MKTLLILRHAKSSWKDTQWDDHDRPLNKRGKHDAPRVGQWIQQRQLQPDLIISSTAKRAVKTAIRVARECGCQDVIQQRESLYLAPPDACLDELRTLDETVSRVLLVGHNPGLEQLVALLTGQPVPLPTAALAHIQLDVAHWCEVNTRTRGTLIDLWQPRSRA